MTISIDAAYAGMLLSVLLASMAGYGILLVVIWQSLNRRLQTLGHEDRDIRNQIHGLLEIMQNHHTDVLNAMVQSNSLMANVYSQKLTQGFALPDKANLQQG
jgi:hypothetical protein